MSEVEADAVEMDMKVGVVCPHCGNFTTGIDHVICQDEKEVVMIQNCVRCGHPYELHVGIKLEVQAGEPRVLHS